MNGPVPRKGILDIDAYVPGKSAAPAGVKLWKLSSNETPLGPSAQAKAAYAAAGEKLELYPDGASSALRAAIAARYGLDPARLICGAGSDELLRCWPTPISVPETRPFTASTASWSTRSPRSRPARRPWWRPRRTTPPMSTPCWRG